MKQTASTLLSRTDAKAYWHATAIAVTSSIISANIISISSLS